MVVPNDDTVAPRSTSQFQPPSVELLTEEPFDERRHVDAEGRAGGDDVAVDARLDLALEEAVLLPRRIPPRAVAPRDVLEDQPKSTLRRRASGIQSEAAQELHGMEGVGPVLRERIPCPQPVGGLEREHLGAPALGGDPCAFGGNDIGRLVGQVAHDLPADRGIGVEQPVDDGHAGSPVPAGSTLWFSRNTLSGSQVRLSAASRAILVTP